MIAATAPIFLAVATKATAENDERRIDVDAASNAPGAPARAEAEAVAEPDAPARAEAQAGVAAAAQDEAARAKSRRSEAMGSKTAAVEP